jgi:hypothetical protein
VQALHGACQPCQRLQGRGGRVKTARSSAKDTLSPLPLWGNAIPAFYKTTAFLPVWMHRLFFFVREMVERRVTFSVSIFRVACANKNFSRYFSQEKSLRVGHFSSLQLYKCFDILFITL